MDVKDKDITLSRRDFLKAAFVSLGAACWVKIADVAVNTAIPLSESDRNFITAQAVKTSYAAAANRLAELLPNGWERVEAGNIGNQNLGAIDRVQLGLAQLQENISSYNKIDRDVAETAVAGSIDALGWKNFQNSGLWVMGDPYDKSDKCAITLNRSAINLKTTNIEILSLGGTPLLDPLAGGIARFDEAFVTPFGEIVGIGDKLPSGDGLPPAKSLFIANPATGEVVTNEVNGLPESIAGSWFPLGDTEENCGVGVLVGSPGSGGDSLYLNMWYRTKNEGGWQQRVPRIDFSINHLESLNIGWSDFSKKIKEVGVSHMTVSKDESGLMGFAEVSVEINGRNRSLVAPFGNFENALDVYVKPIKNGEDQKIIGKVDGNTIVCHSMTENGEERILGISFLTDANLRQGSVDQNTRIFPYAHVISSQIGVRFLSGKRTQIEILDKESGAVIESFEAQNLADIKMPAVLDSEKVIANRNMNSSFPEQDFKWQAEGNTDKIKVGKDTVFIYVPGAGGMVPEEKIAEEVGWEDPINREVFNAKFGSIEGPVFYQQYHDEMVNTNNYGDMLKIMQKYGVFFIPWNFVNDMNYSHGLNIPHLHMAIQTLRLINTLGKKDVVLIGHSKGANVIQEILKMTQEGYTKSLLGQAKIKGAVMYGRVVPPTELGEVFADTVDRSHDLGIGRVTAIMEMDKLWCGIDAKKLEQMGIRTVDIYDPRDPFRFSRELVESLLEAQQNKKGLAAILPQDEVDMLSKLMSLKKEEILEKLSKMDFAPFATTITRPAVTQELIDENFNALLFPKPSSSSDSDSDTYQDYHSVADWSGFLPGIFHHAG